VFHIEANESVPAGQAVWLSNLSESPSSFEMRARLQEDRSGNGICDAVRLALLRHKFLVIPGRRQIGHYDLPASPESITQGRCVGIEGPHSLQLKGLWLWIPGSARGACARTARSADPSARGPGMTA